MAEAAGLALGGIALASLITTCVEFIEYFEDGRDCIRDVNLAVTKVKLMKVRLCQLGDVESTVVQSHSPVISTGTTQYDWFHVDNALPDGASGIMDIIERATKLCTRYCCDRQPREPRIVCKCPRIAARCLSHQRPNSSFREIVLDGRREILHKITRSALWVFHDKKKLNGLISDFDFILSNLEKIIESVDASTQPSQKSIAMGDKRNISRKRDPSHNQIPKPSSYASGPPMEGQQSLLLPSETFFEGNHSNGQSVHFVGDQSESNKERMESLQHRKINYKDNISHDQSFAITGGVAGSVINGMAEAWKAVAIEALRHKNQAKTQVRRSRPEITSEYCKLTET